MDYLTAYTAAYSAALKVATTEDADVRVARDKAAASAGIVASAVKAGEDPGAWFKNDEVRSRPRNVAAVSAVRSLVAVAPIEPDDPVSIETYEAVIDTMDAMIARGDES